MLITYSSSFNGIELWYNDINRNKTFHNVLVGYHEAVKRIPGLCTKDSKLLVYERVGVNIFRYLQAKWMFNFYLLIIRYENKSTISLKLNISYNSFTRKNIVEIFFNDHDLMRLPIYFIMIGLQ